MLTLLLAVLAPWTPVAVEARVTDPKGTDFSLRLEPFSCQLIEK